MNITGAVGLVPPLAHAGTQYLTDPFFLSLLGFLADLPVERSYDTLSSRGIPDADASLARVIDGWRFEGLLRVGRSDQFAVIERVTQQYRRWWCGGAHQEF